MHPPMWRASRSKAVAQSVWERVPNTATSGNWIKEVLDDAGIVREEVNGEMLWSICTCFRRACVSERVAG